MVFPSAGQNMPAFLNRTRMTIPAATRFSGLSQSTLLRRLAAGDIEARKAGRRTLIMFESLKAYLDQLPRAQFQ